MSIHEDSVEEMRHTITTKIPALETALVLMGQEIARLRTDRDKVATLIREWMMQRDHDSCWYYPEIFQEIATALDVHVNLEIPKIPKADFLDGCQRFADQVYVGSKNHCDGKRIGP